MLTCSQLSFFNQRRLGYLPLIVCFSMTPALSEQMQDSSQGAVYTFKVERKPLSDALVDFALDANINIVINAQLIEGLYAAPVVGTHTVEQALQLLLLQTNLSYSYDALTNTYSLSKEEPPQPADLNSPSNSTEAPRQAVEEVRVVGMREAILTATELKKYESGILDLVRAVDIQKFPDANLAEAAQRIPGVSIDRSNNNEGSKVTVRGLGPEFNSILLNGRRMPSSEISKANDSILANATRAFEFANIASENIESLLVWKTSKPDLPSGGIGATIDLQTRTPLTTSEELLLDIKANVDDSSADLNVRPEIAGLFSKHLSEGRVGLLISGSYQERQSQPHSSRISNWYLEDADLIVHANDTVAHDEYWMPFEQIFSIAQVRQKRLNTQAVLQVKPNDQLEFKIDYTRYQLTSAVRADDVTVGFDVINDITVEGAYDDGTVSRFEEFISDYDPDNAFFIGASRGGFINTLYSSGINIQWAPTTEHDVELDIYRATSQSQPANELGHVEFVFGVPDVEAKYFNNNFDIPQVNLEFSDPISNSRLEPWFDAHSGSQEYKQVESQINAWSLRGHWQKHSVENWSFNWGLHEEKYVNQSGHSFYRFMDTYEDFALVPDLIDDALFVRHSSGQMLEEFSGGLAIPFYYTLDLEALLNEYELYAALLEDSEQSYWEPSISTDIDFTEHHEVTERTRAAFIRANFELPYKDWLFSGDLGSRYESTDVASASHTYNPVSLSWFGNYWYTNYTEDLKLSVGEARYTSLLPSINFKAMYQEQWSLRASAGKTLARPDPKLLRPITKVSDIPLPGYRDAVRGNPELQPFISTNFDLAFEWYWDEANYFSANRFYKKVKNFVSTVAFTEPLAFENDAGKNVFITDPLLGEEALDASRLLETMGQLASDEAIYNLLTENDLEVITGDIDDPVATWRVTQANSAESINISGWELATQFVLDSGWGVNFNATLVDSNKGFRNEYTGPQFAITGVSNSFNFIGFYENEKFQTRLAYNWRDDFLYALNKNSNYYSVDEIDPQSQPQFAEAYGQWDASATFFWSDMLSVFLEGINLSGENQRYYSRGSQQMVHASQYGSFYKLGVRLNF